MEEDMEVSITQFLPTGSLTSWQLQIQVVLCWVTQAVGGLSRPTSPPLCAVRQNKDFFFNFSLLL